MGKLYRLHPGRDAEEVAEVLSSNIVRKLPEEAKPAALDVMMHGECVVECAIEMDEPSALQTALQEATDQEKSRVHKLMIAVLERRDRDMLCFPERYGVRLKVQPPPIKFTLADLERFADKMDDAQAAMMRKARARGLIRVE